MRGLGESQACAFEIVECTPLLTEQLICMAEVVEHARTPAGVRDYGDEISINGPASGADPRLRKARLHLLEERPPFHDRYFLPRD